MLLSECNAKRCGEVEISDALTRMHLSVPSQFSCISQEVRAVIYGIITHSYFTGQSHVVREVSVLRHECTLKSLLRDVVMGFSRCKHNALRKNEWDAQESNKTASQI